MKKRLDLIFALLALLAINVSAQERGLSLGAKFTEKRVALVIGNSDYGVEELNLDHPMDDAFDVGQALKELGFEVITRKNLTQKETIRAIREFKEKLRGGVGLFYYAGHGMQVRGENYLIPVGAEIDGEADVSVESVNLTFLLDQIEDAKSRVNIVILDACRDNPFVRRFRSASARGLAPVFAPGGTLIAYSTAPGKVAYDGKKEERNSPYAQALLRHIKTPGIDLNELFMRVAKEVLQKTNPKQTPWIHSSLVEKFYFDPLVVNAGVQKVSPITDMSKSDTKPDASSPAQNAPSNPAPAQSVKGATWVEEESKTMRSLGPSFYRFEADGIVKRRIGFEGDWYKPEDEHWYQTGNTIRLSRRNYEYKSFNRECEGTLKGDRIEGSCHYGDSAYAYSWVLLKTTP